MVILIPWSVSSSRLGLWWTKKKSKKTCNKIIIIQKINIHINIKIKEKRIIKVRNIIRMPKESKKRKKKMGLVLYLMCISSRVCSINRKIRISRSKNLLKSSQNQIGDQYRVKVITDNLKTLNFYKLLSLGCRFNSVRTKI